MNFTIEKYNIREVKDWYTESSYKKEAIVKRGHVTGTKTERKGSNDWYKQIEEENIRRIEAEWQATQASK